MHNPESVHFLSDMMLLHFLELLLTDFLDLRFIINLDPLQCYLLLILHHFLPELWLFILLYLLLVCQLNSSGCCQRRELLPVWFLQQYSLEQCLFCHFDSVVYQLVITDWQGHYISCIHFIFLLQSVCIRLINYNGLLHLVDYWFAAEGRHRMPLNRFHSFVLHLKWRLNTEIDWAAWWAVTHWYLVSFAKTVIPISVDDFGCSFEWDSRPLEVWWIDWEAVSIFLDLAFLRSRAVVTDLGQL